MTRSSRQAHPTAVVDYDDASLVIDARANYFAANGFSDRAYRDRWVRIKLGPIPIAFPNTASRKRAIPLHDLHHIVTGYPTSLVGEAEIGAWEVGGGCTTYWAAWVLNLGAFTYGLLLAPRRVYRAFVRGRHCLTLYHGGWSDDLLGLTVGELRSRLLNGEQAGVTCADRAAFATWVGVVTMPLLLAIVLTLTVVR